MHGIGRFVLAGLLGLAATTIGSTGPLRADPLTIRLGYSGAAEEQLWLLIAKPDLVAKNYGAVYTLDATRFQGSDKRMQAFAADAIDLNSGSAYGDMNADAEGIPSKIIASLSREGNEGFSTPFYAKADSPIKTVADLKGHIVGINGFQTVGQLHLDAALAKVGLKDSDVTITPVPFPAMQDALAAGKIDVGQFPQPFAAMIEKQMPVRKIFDERYGNSVGQEEVVVLNGKDAYLKKNAPAIRAFLADLQAATRYYIDHPKEARQILIDTKMVRITPDIYLTMLDYYRDPTMRPNVQILEAMQDLMIKADFQTKRADVRAMVDTSYLPN